jgi:hypothetical protein
LFLSDLICGQKALSFDPAHPEKMILNLSRLFSVHQRPIKAFELLYPP